MPGPTPPVPPAPGRPLLTFGHGTAEQPEIVGLLRDAEVGQTLEVYRVKQLPGPNKAPPSYRRDLVGHVKIDHVFDDHFAHVTVADGTPAKHDIVELRKN